MVQDKIADMLTRIRNAIQAKHDSVSIPSSKEKIEIARILKEEGFINDFIVDGIHSYCHPTISDVFKCRRPALQPISSNGIQANLGMALVNSVHPVA